MGEAGGGHCCCVSVVSCDGGGVKRWKWWVVDRCEKGAIGTGYYCQTYKTLSCVNFVRSVHFPDVWSDIRRSRNVAQ